MSDITETMIETITETLKAVWLDIRVCAAFLTRIPVSFKEGESERTLAQAARAFPLVGAGVGLASGLALVAAFSLGLNPLASALIALAVSAALTGALHEDGLADMADGFGGGALLDDKLKIMRDSGIGAYGALAIVFGVGLRAAAISGMTMPENAFFALIAVGAMSRAALPLLMFALKPARTDGLGAAAASPKEEDVCSAAAIGIALAFFFPYPGTVLAALAVAAGAALAIAWLAKRQIGGVTGDVLGAAQQTVETAALLVLATTAA